MNINVIVANIILRLFILYYRYFIIGIDICLFFVRLIRGTTLFKVCQGRRVEPGIINNVCRGIGQLLGFVYSFGRVACQCCQLVSRGLYYKHVTIVNDDSSIVSKCSLKLTDDPDDHHRFIIPDTCDVILGQLASPLNNAVFVYFGNN